MQVAFLCINYTKKLGTTKLCDYLISCFSVVMFMLYCLVYVTWFKADSDFADFSFAISCFKEDNTVNPACGFAHWYQHPKFYLGVNLLSKNVVKKYQRSTWCMDDRFNIGVQVPVIRLHVKRSQALKAVFLLFVS